MFYAAAAMRTDETKWAFEGTDQVNLYHCSAAACARLDNNQRAYQAI